MSEAFTPLPHSAPPDSSVEKPSLDSDIALLPGHPSQYYLQHLCQHPALHSGNLTESASLITQAATHVLNIDRASLWLYNAPDTFALINRYDRTLNTHYEGTLLKPGEHVPYFETLASRTGLRVEDVSQPPPAVHYLTQIGLTYQCSGAFLELPIRCGGIVVGVLWCEHSQIHRWTAIENANALSISLFVATAVSAQQYKTLTEKLNHQHQQLRRETIEREQADQAWQESQRFIQSIIDASTNILYIDSFADGSSFYINRWIKNVLGYEPEEMQQLGNSYLEQLVHDDQRDLMVKERQRLAAIEDGEVVENEYRFRHCQGNWRWLLCRETVFKRDRHGQPTQIFGTATDITKRKNAEVALEDFNQELKRLARMDGLTQVANRRSFDEYIERAWKNVGSGRASLSLILCDIDYFKNFNDTYGHQAGDICLKKVAKAIEKTVQRSTDFVARYGGEEFAVVLPNTNATGAERVADEIRQAIRLLKIEHSESEVSDRITLSLGIASISSSNNAHPDMLIAAADQGLYSAKYGGRDRFCISEIEYPQPSIPPKSHEDECRSRLG
ncbi:MAG: diguanylate cyclase [Phormidesmis sp.]